PASGNCRSKYCSSRAKLSPSSQRPGTSAAAPPSTGLTRRPAPPRAPASTAKTARASSGSAAGCEGDGGEGRDGGAEGEEGDGTEGAESAGPDCDGGTTSAARTGVNGAAKGTAS